MKKTFSRIISDFQEIHRTLNTHSHSALIPRFDSRRSSIPLLHWQSGSPKPILRSPRLQEPIPVFHYSPLGFDDGCSSYPCGAISFQGLPLFAPLTELPRFHSHSGGVSLLPPLHSSFPQAPSSSPFSWPTGPLH
ncbi:hypothetical protein SLA2020_071610 [Shorea laevis]